MTSGKYNRGLWALLLLSMSINVFLISFGMVWGAILAHPQAAIHKEFQKWVDQLPDQYKKGAQEQLDLFYKTYEPSINQAEQERKVFLESLLASKVDAAKVQAAGEKIRASTTKIQEGVQASLIAALKDIPREEKMKIVEHNRILKAMMQDAGVGQPNTSISPPATR